jgi:diadenylate cyclase
VAVTERIDGPLRATLAVIAPGTALRDGLERILRGGTGALIVLGYDKVVDSLCTGGFVLDVEFSSTRLRELAKMDGAIVVDKDCTKILRAAVQLVPDPAIPTDESGTRHRTADRVNKQTDLAVISVSQSMSIIAIYVAGQRYVLEDSTQILSRANQALATLERYKLRLDEVSGTLSALEIEDLVTVRDVSAVAQRLEMVRRIAGEIESYVVELGTDGRLLTLQLDELIAGVEPDRELIARDYLPSPSGRRARTVQNVLDDLDALDALELLDHSAVARAFGHGSSEGLDAASPVSEIRLVDPVGVEGVAVDGEAHAALGRAHSHRQREGAPSIERCPSEVAWPGLPGGWRHGRDAITGRLEGGDGECVGAAGLSVVGRADTYKG